MPSHAVMTDVCAVLRLVTYFHTVPALLASRTFLQRPTVKRMTPEENCAVFFFPMIQHLSDITITDNWTGNQLREHGHISTEVDELFLWICVMPVQIEWVRHCLESVEGNANWQLQIQRLDER